MPTMKRWRNEKNGFWWIRHSDPHAWMDDPAAERLDRIFGLLQWIWKVHCTFLPTRSMRKVINNVTENYHMMTGHTQVVVWVSPSWPAFSDLWNTNRPSRSLDQITPSEVQKTVCKCLRQKCHELLTCTKSHIKMCNHRRERWYRYDEVVNYEANA